MFYLKFLFLFAVEIFGHGRLTFPIPRLKNVDGGINAPIYTCLGPAFKTSSTSMRCHDAPSGNIAAIYTSGSTIDLEWIMEAPHPGDCSIWLSYDSNVDSPINWIKIKNIPGCLSVNGIDLPIGVNKFSFKLPEFLPSCDHCVLRWEWYSVQQVSNVEFYVNCVDIKIISQNDCQKPGPVTQINGIEHLLYNLNDLNQNGCPFYNPYDINIRPTLQSRSRGPKEWVPFCNDNPVNPVIPTIKPIVYPCANINCGEFGVCENNICICKNGYTGNNCEIKPMITCNINCKILNRNACQINNICGTCLSGFVEYNNNINTLCKIQCDNNLCKNLNRKTCTGKNICGNCLNGFTEPKSSLKSDSCIISNSNVNGIKFSVSAQWNNGFCGKWIATCPQNKIISFEVPNEIVDLRGWNMINMVKINNLISGYCAPWVQIGNQASGGFCAAFSLGRSVVINENGYVFSKKFNRFRKLKDNESFENIYKNFSLNFNINQNVLLLDNSYKNVSVTLNVDENTLDYEYIHNEIEKNLYGVHEIIFLNLENSELSVKINCENRQDFDDALFLDINNIDPEFNPEPITDEFNYDQTSSSLNNNSSDKLNLSLLLTSSLFLFSLIILF